MRMTFDYVLPQIAAENETLRVSEHGTLDLEDGTLDFCIGDVSHLKDRVIPVEGFLYSIAQVEFYKSEERGGSESVGLLHLEDFEEDEDSEESGGIPGWVYLTLVLFALAIIYYIYPHWFHPG